VRQALVVATLLPADIAVDHRTVAAVHTVVAARTAGTA